MSATTFPDINLTNTFNEWRTAYNSLKSEINTDVLRVGGPEVTGNVRVNGTINVATLNVTLASTFANTLGITGAVTLSNTLAVAGISSLTGNLDLVTNSTALRFGSSADVILSRGAGPILSGSVGGTTVFTANVTHLVPIALHVDGAGTINGAATLSNTVGITGAITASNTLALTGAATLSNNLSVAGVLDLTGNLNFVTNSTTLRFGSSADVILSRGSGPSLIISPGAVDAVNVNSTAVAVLVASTFANTVGITGAATLSNTLGVTGAATLSANLAVAGQLLVSNTGPHVVGGAVDTKYAMLFTGAYTVSGDHGAGHAFGRTLTAATNGSLYGGYFFPTLTMLGVGNTHDLFAGLRVDAPTIAGTGGTVTKAVSFYVGGPPSGASTNLALEVVSGETRLGGAANLASTLAVAGLSTLTGNTTMNGARNYANGIVDVNTTNGRLVLPVGVDKWAT